jgi:hypothetical protein
MSKNRQPKLKLVPPPGDTARPMPGRVTHDARGNAIWDWAIATGVLAHKTFDELVTTLDKPGALSLDQETQAAQGWSGDPYNRCGK